MADLVALLTRLCATPGPSGHEEPIRSVVQSLWQPYVNELRTDRLGNVIALKRGTGPTPRRRIMLSSHMDEIALIVTALKDGFLHVTEVGGIDIRLLGGQEVTVHATGHTPGGPPLALPGVIGARPPHLLAPDARDQSIPMEQVLVDVGLTAEECAHYVRPGDLITFARPAHALSNGRFSGHALDNRASVAAVTVCLEALQSRTHAWDVYAVATVQEETTLGGALTGAHGIEPDAAVALDVSFGRGPGVNEFDGVTLDGGPAIALGPNFHPRMVQQLRDAAARAEIPYQLEPEPTPPGTDARAIQMAQSGIPCGLISIPLRYMHSPTEVIALRDVERAGRLLAECLSALPADFLIPYVVV